MDLSSFTESSKTVYESGVSRWIISSFVSPRYSLYDWLREVVLASRDMHKLRLIISNKKCFNFFINNTPKILIIILFKMNFNYVEKLLINDSLKSLLLICLLSIVSAEVRLNSILSPSTHVKMVYIVS